MAVLFIDGFDNIESAAMALKWDSVTVSNIGSDYAYGLGQGIRITSTSSCKKILPAAHNPIICGFYLRYECSTWTASNFITFGNGAVNHCSFGVTAAGLITFSRGSTVLATSTNALSVNTWYHVETKVTISDTVGTYEIRINGVNWLSGTGVDNNNAGTNGVDTITILGGGASSKYCWWDDFYVLNTTSPNDTFLGPQKVLTIYPYNNGTRTEWSTNYLPNYMNINQPISKLGYAFNYTGTAEEVDAFKFNTSTAGNITAIAVSIIASQDVGNQRYLKYYKRFNSTDYLGSSILLTSSYKYYQTIEDQTPLSNAWAAADINASEFGYYLEA